MGVDPGVLIASGSAALVALASIHQTRIGKRQEREQQKAANELQLKAQNHDVYRDMVADLERQVDRRDLEIADLRSERLEERRNHIAELAHLRDIIATLRDVVHSEIATTLADDGINASERHDPSEER